MTTPTGMSPASRASEVGRRQERRADERREWQDVSRRRTDDEPDDMGHDEADEADEAATATAGCGRQRGHREQDPALPPDVDPEVACRRVAEQHPVERAGAHAHRDAGDEDERRRHEQP